MEKKKEPKVIIKFDQSPYFEQEFLEFVERHTKNYNYKSMEEKIKKVEELIKK